MRNYAGHRLAPWLAHVMVSRQETARALLTPGEVMQLPPVDELVLVAGHAPVRAKKLRYYEDRTFKARILPAPALASGGYADLPKARADDWHGLVRGTDARLGEARDNSDEKYSSGGLEQVRHPAHELEAPVQQDVVPAAAASCHCMQRAKCEDHDAELLPQLWQADFSAFVKIELTSRCSCFA